MIDRLRKARRLAKSAPVVQRSNRRRPHITCPAEPVAPVAREALDMGRARLMMTGAILTLAFAVVGMRLVDVTLLQAAVEPRVAYAPKPARLQFARSDILDRNGVLLATSLPTASLYANPRQVQDADFTAKQLVTVLTELTLAD